MPSPAPPPQAEHVTLAVRNGHAHCRLCGETTPWSVGVRFTAGEDGGVHATLPADLRLQGYDGLVHGGVIAALLDAAMTHCLFHAGIRALTAELHVRYLAPVAIDSTMEISASITASRSRLHELQAEISVGGEVAARGGGKFLRVATKDED